MCHLILFLPFLALPVFWMLPPATALAFYLFILGISMLLYVKVFQAMRRKVLTGSEGMLGKKGVVVEDIDPEGKLLCGNEIWYAEANEKRFLKGDTVRVSGIHGLILVVEELPVVGKGVGRQKCHS